MTKHMFLSELKKVGLSEKEARVYLATLELGETSISRIADKAKIKRSTVYLTIESLKGRGLISSVKRKNKALFFAEDPRKLEKIVSESKRAISSVMPDLLTMGELIDRRPRMRYFEGDRALEEVFEDVLEFPNQEILVWFPDETYSLGDNYFLDYFSPKRVEKKIWVRAIAPDNETNRRFELNNKKHLRKMKFVSDDKFCVGVNMMLYGKNKIGILSYKENVGVIIESQNIHDALKNIFEFMWGVLN
jgi:sugar-specific transcriptional regulator TrmB